MTCEVIAAARTVGGALVCGDPGTAESIPATFGRCGALMSVGFPTGAFDAIASQTPMSFCAARCIHMYTHQRSDVQHCPHGTCGVRGVVREVVRKG
jgi:hypothetical protein